ncbi:MAG: ABC transporter substrate-binding protein [Acidobacteriota bacterium]|nr:ABC transporter substrate-binding protein [Acidobacteriota bacterium]
MTRALTLFPLLAIAALVACGGGGDAEVDDGTGAIKVGAIFDLTGPTSDVGTTFSEGLRDYVEWVNAKGGLEGRQVDLIFQDYQYKVDVAEQLYSQFVQEGVVAFMGWGTGDTEALRGRIADDKIPFASASFSHVLGDPAEAPYNFLLGTSYSDQFIILLDYIAEHHEGGSAAVALMHHPSPFGVSPLEQGGRDYAESKGIALTSVEMARGNTDFTAELTNIRKSGAQYIVFNNTSGPASVALKNAASLGVDAKFFCLNWCTNRVLTDLAGEAAEGLVGAVTFSPPGEGITGLDEAAAFLASKGGSIEQGGLLYGQGWTMMRLMLEGIRRTVAAGQELSGPNIRTQMESIRDFDTGGVTEPVTLGPADHRGMRSMRLYEIVDGSWSQLTDFRSTSWGT